MGWTFKGVHPIQLFSLAIPPEHSTNGYFYVNYTRTPDGATTISRFRVMNDPDITASNSEEVLLTIQQPFATTTEAKSPSVPGWDGDPSDLPVTMNLSSTN